MPTKVLSVSIPLMKRSFFLVSILILFCFSAPVSNGQQASTPDDGGVSNGVYSNKFFGFSVTYPKDWVVHGDATNVRLKELGKERATTTGAMSAASSEVVLKNTYQLLTTFQYPMGAPKVEVNSGFMLVAEKVSHAPGIVNGRDYLFHVRPMMIKTGLVPVLDEPTQLLLSRHKFFRQDSRMQVNGMSVHQTIIITVIKGYALAFILSGKDQLMIDEMAKVVSTLKFVNSPSPAPTK